MHCINDNNFCLNNIVVKVFKSRYIAQSIHNNCVKQFLMNYRNDSSFRNFEFDHLGASNLFASIWPKFGQRLKSAS